MKKNWVALFSQTGSEIVALSKILGYSPDFIISDNIDQSKYKHHPELNDLKRVIMKGSHDNLMMFLRDTIAFVKEDTIFTLHGYLRIIPEDVCDKYEIYNGHPGLITKYPELKGKDPQLKVWQSIKDYTIIGSVVHRVTAGVDEGEVISEVCYINRCSTEEELFDKLRESSLSTWNFFMNKMGMCE